MSQDEPAPSPSITWRCASNEPRDKGVSRSRDEVVDSARLKNPALAQQNNFVAKVRGFAEVVRHQDDRFLERLKNLPEIGLQI